jgi:hypothetical protein
VASVWERLRAPDAPWPAAPSAPARLAVTEMPSAGPVPLALPAEVWRALWGGGAQG